MEVATVRFDNRVSPWTTLGRELDAWGSGGRRATLWWRDDDATSPGPALDRLLETRRDLPLAIAAVPARTGAPLAARLGHANGVIVIQHGYSHENHAPPGAKKSEFPAGRPITPAIETLACGRQRLSELFGHRFLPVLAPPWNRIDPTLAGRIGDAGLRALSGFGNPAPATHWINAHLDPIDWRGTRGFVGEAAALNTLVEHLGKRRRGELPDEPSGLLTHHRDNDAAVWRFLSALIEFTRGHPAARWVSIEELS